MNLEPKTPLHGFMLAGAIGCVGLCAVLGAVGFFGAAVEKVRREWNKTAGDYADEQKRRERAKEGMGRIVRE